MAGFWQVKIGVEKLSAKHGGFWQKSVGFGASGPGHTDFQGLYGIRVCEAELWGQDFAVIALMPSSS